MENTISFLTEALLSKHKIRIDTQELDFQIESHPSYPSLHAVTGVLSHFNIDHLAIRVPVDKEALEQLPSSFIAQIKIKDTTDFALILKKGENYKVILSSKEDKTISKATFLEQFTGIVVAVEKDETNSIHQKTTINFQKPFFIIALILLGVLFFKSSPSLNASVYFILSIVGAAISYLIVQHDLGLSSKIIDRICSQESKTTNCNAVLNSKGATIYKNIKLSDVSIIYFASLSMSSLLLSMTNSYLNLLYLISLVALPIVIYSFYYQIKISKTWCVLCLGVATILILQASIFFFTNFEFSMLNFESLLLIGFSFILVFPSWLFISSKLKQEQAFKSLKISSNKIKRNFDLFNTLLEKSITLNTVITDASEITLGNKNAPLNITVITNPFCGHCKDVHNLMESIVKKHHNILSVTIRFNINTSNVQSDGVLVSSRLLELFHTEGEQKCFEAMHDIYNNAVAKSWIDKWGKRTNSNAYIPILESEYNWCLDNNINFTPEILINGKSFPMAYDRSDLAFFIEDLHDYYLGETKTTKLQYTV
ncbi:MAG: vitamin K epoxide reductase family protein [Xanthomarina sp.]